MNLGETVTYCCLEEVVLMLECPYTHCVCPVPFGGRAGYNRDASHVFPQGVLTAIILVGGGAGNGGVRAAARFKAIIPLCSVAISTLSGAGSDPKLLEQKP